jgi:hypothetical protein
MREGEVREDLPDERGIVQRGDQAISVRTETITSQKEDYEGLAPGGRGEMRRRDLVARCGISAESARRALLGLERRASSSARGAGGARDTC